MPDASIKWETISFDGYAPARLAGAGGTLNLYKGVISETSSDDGAEEVEVTLKAVPPGRAASVISDAEATSGVDIAIGFEQVFVSAPDWDLSLDESGNGAAVMQLFGGAWNDLLYVTIAKGVASDPVRFAGQDFSAPRLFRQLDGSYRILARGDLDGLVSIDPARPTAEPTWIGAWRSALSLDIGGGESAWLFQEISDVGPLSPVGIGAAPVLLGIGPTGKVPGAGDDILGGAPIFEFAAASSHEGVLVFATGPGGIHAAAIDVHGAETQIAVGTPPGILSSPSVALLSDGQGSFDGVLTVLHLKENLSAEGVSFARVPFAGSASPAPAA
ncbi:MAG: hypothetical protein JJ959_19730 [Nisaea sp.]|uniref:hypothetical protein n=1 Tax=Nisaea sp. TaxID=2024842 RepID=UPI001B18C6FF|nr:hypothetical protein [Nisaea sp.]MBO6562789.1 hypothetical protein [Nisaea sp.]